MKFYFSLAIQNLGDFPLFGMQYDSLKSLIKNMIQENTKKTIRANLINGYRDNVPQEIKASRRKLKTMKDVYPYLKESFLVIPSVRIMNKFYATDQYPKVRLCFTDYIIARSLEILSNIHNRLSEAPCPSLQEVEQLINLRDNLYASYRNARDEDKRFAAEREKADFIINILIHTVIKGIKPIVAEFRQGDLNRFIREWFPVFFKGLDHFGEEYSTKIHPARWFPGYFQNPCIFARNALSQYFTREIRTMFKFIPPKGVRIRSGYELEEKRFKTAGMHRQYYDEDGLGYRQTDFDIRDISALKVFEDRSEPEKSPRRHFYKTTQIAKIIRCQPRSIRRYLTKFMQQGLLSAEDVYRKTTDGYRNVWRVCQNSLNKVVKLVQNEFGKNNARQKNCLINELCKIRKIQPDKLAEIRSLAARMPAEDLERLLDQMKQQP